MRLALISDIHFGPEAFKDGHLRKLSHEADRLTREVVAELRQSVHPDVLVNLGDVIEDESLEADRTNYRSFLEAISAFDGTVLHVAGNHDTVHMSEGDLKRLWGRTERLYYSRDIGGLHLVVLHSIETKDVDVRVDDEQLAWLQNDLSSTTLPTIVFVHHPASDMRLEGNRWFEKAPHICRIVERKRLREILNASGRVLAVFNGHAHWNHLDVIDTIPYVTLQSLTENLDEDAPGRPARAWAIVDVSDRRIGVDVRGEHRLRYQFERR